MADYADTDEKCYACGKRFRRNSYGRIPYHPTVLTIDGQRQYVGYDCHRKIVEAGKEGYQPERGGPRLYTEMDAPPEALQAAGIIRTYTAKEKK